MCAYCLRQQSVQGVAAACVGILLPQRTVAGFVRFVLMCVLSRCIIFSLLCVCVFSLAQLLCTRTFLFRVYVAASVADYSTRRWLFRHSVELAGVSKAASENWELFAVAVSVLPKVSPGSVLSVPDVFRSCHSPEHGPQY